MIKYVIQSGGLKNEPEAAKAYFAELLDGLGEKPTLLWCFFATPSNDRDEYFEKYTKLFATFMPENINPIHTNATVGNFYAEVAETDVVYMHGGSIKPLVNILSKYDLSTLFEGKTVGTNSASSAALAQYAWDCDNRMPVEGLGVLPLKFFAHFKSQYGKDDPRGPIDWNKAYRELAEYGDTSLPIYALREGEYVTKER